jgi:membrane peptidoglycan carboxypeptidase
MGINAQLDAPARFEAKGLGSGGAKGCPPATWCVQNDGNYRGQLSVTDALATSPNTAFAKLISQVGVQRTVDMAVKLGLRSYALPGTARDYDPQSNESLADFVKRQNLGSFTLGPIELNALELSNVAATLASGGVWCPPNPIDKVFDRTGKDVAVTTETCEQVVPEGLANTLANALSKDDQSGTAASAAGSARPAPRRHTARRGSSVSPAPSPRPTTSMTTRRRHPTCVRSHCDSAARATCTAATSPPGPGLPR